MRSATRDGTTSGIEQEKHTETPVTHQDVAAYFSEDEWKLLHNWQQELYSKVIHEVHKALISLGPLIATTVSALRSKEMKDGCTVEHQDSARCSIGRNTSKQKGQDDANSVDSFWVDQDENTTFKAHPETDIKDHKDCSFVVDKDLKTDQDFARSLMKHHNLDDRENVNSFNSGQVDATPIVKFQIKEEVESYVSENRGSDIMDNANGSQEHENMNTQENNGTFLKTCEWILPCASSERNAALRISGEQTHSGNEIRSKYYHGLGEVKTAHSESSFVNPSEPNLDEETPKQLSTRTYNTCTVNLVKTNLLSFCVQPKSEPKSFSAYKKSFSQNTGFVRHRDDRPFKCSECEKSFRQKAHLIRHQATHRGDRPFHCAECQKCFSRNEYLIVHQRKHTGEIPYKCSVCMKGFRQKRSLVSHQAMHKGTLTQREVTSMHDKLPS